MELVNRYQRDRRRMGGKMLCLLRAPCEHWCLASLSDMQTPVLLFADQLKKPKEGREHALPNFWL